MAKLAPDAYKPDETTWVKIKNPSVQLARKNWYFSIILFRRQTLHPGKGFRIDRGSVARARRWRRA